MNKLFLISSVLFVPALLFADVSINLSFTTRADNYDCDVDVDYVDEGEPWFEEEECSGPERISFEYQWSMHGSGHVLRYRRVSFHTVSGAWVFGPWLVKVNYCHPACNVHHKHIYYHKNVSHPHWYRVYDNHKQVYYYEYRKPDHGHRNEYKVYRHEYKPRHVTKAHDNRQPNHSDKGVYHHNNKNGNHNLKNNHHKPQFSQPKDNHKPEQRKSNSNLQKKSIVKSSPDHSKGSHSNKKEQNHSNSKIVRISGRN